MSTTLAYDAESLVIALLALDSRLSGITIRHDVPPTEIDSALGIITVKAVQGEQHLALRDVTGPSGYDLEVMVEYRAKGSEDATTGETIEQAIRDRLFTPPPSTPSEASKFSLFSIEHEAEGAREDKKLSRDRSIKAHCIALSSTAAPTVNFIVTERDDNIVTENGDLMIA